MILFPDEYKHQLKDYNYTNGFADKDDLVAAEYIARQHALVDKLLAGTLYIKFRDGDRKGAIAKVAPNTDKYGNNAYRKASVEYSNQSWNRDRPYQIRNDSFYMIATWDKRSNKVQVSIPNYYEDVVFLPNYSGPTVWALFDRKAAKEEALKDPNQYDIDGKLLAIGDEVLYINARYGSGMTLCHGKIKEFKVSVDSRKKEISTVVELYEETTEPVLSEIANSHNFIWKKPIAAS